MYHYCSERSKLRRQAVQFWGSFYHADVRGTHVRRKISWGRGRLRRLSGASTILGLAETTFGPREHATRAQSAVLLKRMLQAMQWINP